VNISSKVVLVIAPHQDDEVIGCGGTIAKRVKNGDDVYIIYMVAGWSGIPDIQSHEEATRVREKEAAEACRILGIKDSYFLREEDRGLVYNAKTLHALIRIIREIKPNILYCPHSREADFEHRVTHILAREAIWLAATPFLPELGEPIRLVEQIYHYEVWTPLEQPDVLEDITEFMDIKIKALSVYKSQLNKTNYVEAIKGLNRYRGIMAGIGEYVEAFELARANNPSRWYYGGDKC